ncbi:MAG: WYL domain-containing protein [Cyanobacteria bacterium J06642_2]
MRWHTRGLRDIAVGRSTPAHAYTTLAAFERLLLIVAAIALYPGVGAREDEDEGGGLEQLQARVTALGTEYGIEVRARSVATLRKDIATLRQYGILGRQPYREGYFIGTGVMSPSECELALQALRSMGHYQADPMSHVIYQAISKRLRGHARSPSSFESLERSLYPVRQQLNRVVHDVDPEEMMRQGRYRRTLIHHLDALERAMVSGQVVELSRSRNVYASEAVGARTGTMQVWPLQLAFHDVAWYLIYDVCPAVGEKGSGHLAIGRLDRFADVCRVIENIPARSLEMQLQRLEAAHRLVVQGWGLFLGGREEQRRELAGLLKFETVRVRFWGEAVPFIVEGERRHPSQTIRKGSRSAIDGRVQFVDYQVMLPPRSLSEFCRWSYKFVPSVQFLAPQSLADKHREVLKETSARYGLE